MKFLSIIDEWKCEAYPRIGDSIAFIFKHTYTATRIIINQLSIKCTRTRTITFPQLYNIRSNWKEGDEFLLPQKPLRTTLFLLLPSLSITSIPHIHTQMWSSRRKELSMQVSLQAHPSEVEMIILHTLSHSSRTKVCDKPRTRREHKPREREQSRRASLQQELHATSCSTSTSGDPLPEVLIIDHLQWDIPKGTRLGEYRSVWLQLVNMETGNN